MFKQVVISSGLAALANGHMLLANPKPFSTPQLSNGPLDPSGSNFPCKMVAGASFSGQATQMALGSKQSMSFTGSAVHGGGSCQISISYDTSPTPNSQWKVIHSIEGGCPARNTAGNLPADSASAADPNQYPYTIPSNLKTGKATLAWSWLNKVGNREFYMNCAPIELTGKSVGDGYNSLPDIYVANLEGINSCTTQEGADYAFPNPGSSSEKNGSPVKLATCSGKFSGAAGSGGSSGGAPSGGNSSPAAGGDGPARPTAAPASPPAAGGADAGPGDGGVFVTGTGAASQPSATSQPSASSAAAAPSASASSPAGSGSSGSGSNSGSGSGSSGSGAGSGASSGSGSGSSSSGGSCTPGTFQCVDGSNFKQCIAGGTWSATMQMASGTKCTVGESTSLAITTRSGKKRSIRSLKI